MSAPLLQARISQLANKRLEVEEKEGWLRKDDKYFNVKRAQRLSALESGLREVAEKWTDDMICKFESKPFIRGAYYLVTQLLTRAYHQGIEYNSCLPRDAPIRPGKIDSDNRHPYFQRGGFASEESGRRSPEKETKSNISSLPSFSCRLRFNAVNLLSSWIDPPRRNRRG